MHNFLAAYATEFHISRTPVGTPLRDLPPTVERDLLAEKQRCTGISFPHGRYLLSHGDDFFGAPQVRAAGHEYHYLLFGNRLRNRPQAGKRLYPTHSFFARKPAQVWHSTINNLPNNKRQFIEKLPPEFRRKDAVEIGEGYGLSRATVDRMLEALTGSLFDCAQHGVYSKRSENEKVEKVEKVENFSVFSTFSFSHRENTLTSPLNLVRYHTLMEL